MSQQYFYDAQFKNIISQFVRVFSGFKYMTGKNRTGKKELIPVLCQAGNISRMVASLAKKNSDNVALYAPMISCWISNVAIARNRTKSPTHINQIQVTEQQFNYGDQRYTGQEGTKYVVDRLMPVPFDITMQVDIWTTNEEMKMQIIEQILILFNPAITFQKNENPLDWTNYLDIELESINWSSRSIPIGDDSAFEITSLTFKLDQFYLNPPAKVKKQVAIQNIITNVGFDQPENEIIVWQPDEYWQFVDTYNDLHLEVIGDELRLVSFGAQITWFDLFQKIKEDFEPLKFWIRLRPGYEITYANADILFSIDDISSSDPSIAIGTMNRNTLPSTTIDPVLSVLNPRAIFPNNGLVENLGDRYIISEDIIPNTQSWGAFSAKAGSIIEFDGSNWFIDLDSSTVEMGSVVRILDDNNIYVQVTPEDWIDVYQGNYRPGFFRLVSLTNNMISN